MTQTTRQERLSIGDRVSRLETRIKRDIRGWIGWDYIEEVVDLCEEPLVAIILFLTGGRATEVLDYTRGMFADIGTYYVGIGLPVYKRFRVLETHIDRFTGKKTYDTQLEVDRRTIPILKTEPLAEIFWKLIKDIPRENRLLHWPEHRNQYWQLYKNIAEIPTPISPLAPIYYEGEKEGEIKNLYPHWFRGMKAAQLRVQYNLDVAKLCDFFKWETLDMARHYAGLSVVDMVVAMKQGERFMEVWENMFGRDRNVYSEK